MTTTTAAAIGAILLFAMPAALAADCKYEVDKKDKFTKQHLRLTKWERVTPFVHNRTVRVAARMNGDKRHLLVQLTVDDLSDEKPHEYEREDAIVIPAGAALLLMRADEHVVKLVTEEERRFDASYQPPNTGTNGYDQFMITSAAEMAYALDARAIAELSNRDVSNLRIEAADTNYDVQIFGKSLGDIGRIVACLEGGTNE